MLGPVRLTDAGGTVRPAGRGRRLLLTALAVGDGRVVPADRLVALLWGDELPGRPLHALRGRVHRLRSDLGDDMVRTAPPGYALGPAVDLDARRFVQLLDDARTCRDDGRVVQLLDRALALWRGPAHAEFADHEVARAAAVRLEELRLAAVELRAAALRRLGRGAEAVPDLRAVLDEQPLRHGARVELVRALHADGQRVQALARCRELRELLREEQGLDVPVELARLEERVLRDEPAVHPDEPDDAGTGAHPAAPPAPLVHPVGRTDDLAALEQVLQDARLVSLVGVGGVGKTTVALQAAQRRASSGAATWWCELAAARPGELVDALAEALGVRGTGPSDDAVRDVLRARTGLLVLDSLEHVLEDGRQVVGDLVAACPGLRVLVTSRAPLGLPGEHVVRLEPLDPDGDAVTLLLERTRELGRELDPAVDGQLLRQLAARLDGLPLALELAASRLRALTPQELLERIEEHPDEVVVDDRRRVARHRGLRAVLDWSHGLLSDVEQRLFRRLAVFPADFPVADAERVAAGDGLAADEVLDLLQRLVDHSMVVATHTAGSTRHHLLETLRAYAAEHLDAAGEAAAVQRRHAAHHLRLADEAARLVRGRDERRGVDHFDATRDDRRAALRRLRADEALDPAMRLCAATLRYALWRLRGEEFRSAEQVLALPGAGDHELLPTVAGMVGWGAALRGETDAAMRWADRGLAVIDGPHDPRALVPLEVRMHVALWSGDLETCLQAAERADGLVDDPHELVPAYVPCLALAYAGRPEEALERLGPVRERAARSGNPSMQALVAYTRGEVLLLLDPPRADEPLRRAVEHAAAVDNEMVLGVADVSLAALRSRLGRTREAVEPFGPMVRRLHARGDWTHLWTGLRGLVPLLVRLGHPEQAAELLGAVTSARQAPTPYGEDAVRLQRARRRLEDDLGASRAEELQVRGAALAPDDAVALAQAAVVEVLAG